MFRQRAYHTCIEMLTTRGYTITDSVYTKDNTYITGVYPNKDNIKVLFTDSDKLDTKMLRNNIIHLLNDKVKHGIIIYKNIITPGARKALEYCKEIELETFAEHDLQINITKHRLQPIFERLTDKEQIIFKEKYGDNLPIMISDKPISRFYNYKHGNIIRVIRKNGFVAYRVVRDPL